MVGTIAFKSFGFVACFTCKTARDTGRNRLTQIDTSNASNKVSLLVSLSLISLLTCKALTTLQEDVKKLCDLPKQVVSSAREVASRSIPFLLCGYNEHMNLKIFMAGIISYKG